MKVRKQNLTKEFILSHVSPRQIFEKFLDLDNVNRYINTNVRFINNTRIDDFPTCTLKEFPNGVLWFRDWASSKGYDCFSLVQYIYNDCTFYDALELIALQFNLLDRETSNELKYVVAPKQQLEILRETVIPKIRIKSKPFSQIDVNYWNQYHLELSDLSSEIKALKCYWYEEAKFFPSLSAPSYAYDWDNYDYKLYFPLNDRKKGEIKHLHNNAKIIQGEKYLKYDKSTLFITSSNKDIQVLRKIDKLYDLDAEFIAPMSETMLIPLTKIEFWKTKYKSMLLYHNGDKAGIENSEVQSNLYDISYIVNPENEPKDISDFVKENGLESGFDLINHLIYE